MGIALRSGNEMTAHGALAAGCTFFSGYPITPSSAVYLEMMRRLPARGGVALGAPDEISALSYAVGASLAGARAMTATSGPGWSLMIETVQYALMTETPVVIVVVQRLGPATGGATQGAQGDVLFVEYANSGGYPIPVLAPTDALDSYTLTAKAFRLAEELRMPVVVLSDKETAMTIESVDLAALPPVAVEPRAAAPDGAAFLPYRIDRLEDVPRFAPVGGEHTVTATGSAHNDRGQLRKNDPETLRQLRHLRRKVEARAADMELVRHHRPAAGARVLLVSYGVSARTCRQVVREHEDVSLLEVLSLYPVPHRALRAALEGIERVVIVEENDPGLYARELRPHLDGVEARQVNDVGAMITPDAILEAVVA
ncbi:MAG: transketolase C-terminal domain-containing protein [Planctomycetota bacterium]